MLPLAAVVGVFGISFGVLARDAGAGTVAPVVMSLTTFAGSAQFAVVSVLGGGGSVASAAIAALLLNARYGAIGLSVAPVLHRWPPRRLAEAQLVVDESWALASRGEGRFERNVLLGAGLVLYSAWAVGTVAGILAGDLVDPKKLGLDAAFPALFLGLLWPQLRDARAIGAAIAAAGIALALVPFTEPGIPIIAGAAVCVLGLRR